MAVFALQLPWFGLPFCIMTTHNCLDLIHLFNDLFATTENTVLIGDGEEPLYLPADATSSFNRIIFTRNYFASALHEIAHWCIASAHRRTLVDYGYWYFPEGRNAEQQRLFEQAEIKPQALEFLFSEACGSRFIASQDNLATGHGDAALFEKNIAEQVQCYLSNGLPALAGEFRNRLLDFYSGSR